MLLRAFGHLLDRSLVVVLALGAAQFPVFYGQYADTLAGAHSEAQARYQELQRKAAELQLSVDQFIERHETNSDPVFRASGEIHRSTVTRYRRLDAALNRVRGAAPWEKAVVLAQVYDPQIAGAMKFEPGLPLTIEGLAYGFAGLLIAALLAGSTRALVGRAGRRGVPVTRRI